MSNTREPWLRPFTLPQIEPVDGLTYGDLAEFGAGYDSSMSEINRAGLDAQRRRQLTPERRHAWRQLRDAEKRLVLDFLHVQTDPAAFGEESGLPPGVPALERPVPVLPETPEPTEEELIAALGPVESLPPPNLDPGPPPPLVPDVWELLEEVMPPSDTETPPLPEPTSFLEDEA